MATAAPEVELGERVLDLTDESERVAGDPTLGGAGLLLAIDADCPGCGWPERWYDTTHRKFGCIKCVYTSDERNA